MWVGKTSYVQWLKKITGGWEDDLMSKVLAVQIWEPEFKSLELT